MIPTGSSGSIRRPPRECAPRWEAGMTIDRADVVRWLTINPARALGIDKVTGSLEPGKNADVVIWSGDPFSVYAKAERVFIDGALMYDRSDPARQPRRDFMVGTGPDPNFVPFSKPGATAARPNEPIAAKKPNILGSAPGAERIGVRPRFGA